MKVLVLAPHPYYQERGTPIALDLLLSTLSAQGHTVDVITFNEGENRYYRNTRIIRVRGPVSVSGVKPGFSMKKLYLDVFLFLAFVRRFFSQRYDVVHAVEEAAFMAWLLCPLRGVPYIYDMDSSMATQILDKFSALRPFERTIRWCESLPAKSARVVVPCCDALARDVEVLRRGDGRPTIVLKDISLLDKSRKEPGDGRSLRDCIADNAESIIDGIDTYPIALYIGNLESYQGIDLMLEGFAEAIMRGAKLILAIVGGEDEHVTRYKVRAKQLGVEKHAFFLGKKPVTDLYALMCQADIMLSPRIQGVNTPMKVYSYLDSGRPVLATRLVTHTQVMTDEIAVLVEPVVDAFAEGLLSILNTHDACSSMVANAGEFIKAEHSLDAFSRTVTKIYQQVR